MIVKIINGSCNRWTYYEAAEFSVNRLKKKDLEKFEYIYHGQEVSEEHTVFQLCLVNNNTVKYVVVPGEGKCPVYIMGTDGKTVDKIS